MYIMKYFEDEFGKDCSVSFAKVNEDRHLYVEYNGENVGWWCDDFSFNGKADEIMDEYEVCVKPLYFSDPDCAVQLEYTTTYGGVTLQVCFALVHHYIASTGNIVELLCLDSKYYRILEIPRDNLFPVMVHVYTANFVAFAV